MQKESLHNNETREKYKREGNLWMADWCIIQFKWSEMNADYLKLSWISKSEHFIKRKMHSWFIMSYWIYIVIEIKMMNLRWHTSSGIRIKFHLIINNKISLNDIKVSADEFKVCCKDFVFITQIQAIKVYNRIRTA